MTWVWSRLEAGNTAWTRLDEYEVTISEMLADLTADRATVDLSLATESKGGVDLSGADWEPACGVSGGKLDHLNFRASGDAEIVVANGASGPAFVRVAAGDNSTSVDRDTCAASCLSLIHI